MCHSERNKKGNVIHWTDGISCPGKEGYKQKKTDQSNIWKHTML